VSLAGVEGDVGGGQTVVGSILRTVPETVTVAHFAMAQVPATIASAQLTIPLHCLQPDPPDGVVQIYLFAGDGLVSVDEWDAGELIGSQGVDPGEYPVVTLDVTARLQEYQTAANDYFSVRIRTAVGSDDYDLGTDGGVDPPYLTVWP